MEIDEAAVMVQEEKSFPENIALTENASFTHISTKNACLDFFFEVMQNTQNDQIVELLKKSWDEDPLISLKLIFQLRDIRSGKGAVIEFHHCLIWLFHNHPKTLLYNLEYVVKHSYWKDLSWFIKFLLEEHVSMTKERQNPLTTSEMRRELVSNNCSLEEIIRKRVNGVVRKSVWKRYLKQLPDDESRKNAQLKFKELSKALHLARSREAKLKKKSAKAVSAVKLSNFKTLNQHFSAVYDKVVNLFASALKRDKEALDKDKCLPMTALAGKWAPAIGGSIDSTTSLGKNIARTLYSMTHQRDGKESDSYFDAKAFIYYRKEFLTPLRASIKVPEQTMSKKKWTELDYQRVPSVCMKRNKKHFLNNDKERFNQYLEDVKLGKRKIASGALLPHEIVREFMHSSVSPEELMTVGELQWKSYVENLKKSGLFESCLSVCDVSGSMSGDSSFYYFL